MISKEIIKNPKFIVFAVIIFIVFYRLLISSLSAKIPKKDNITSEITDNSTQIPEKKGNTVNEQVKDEEPSVKYTVTEVVDGDTLKVFDSTNTFTIRLIGIDTPELSHPTEPIQCYGQEAKQALSDLLLNKEVILEKDVSDIDKYDRLLRYIWINEIFVNEFMTVNGYAIASSYPPDMKYQERIDEGEKIAKSTKLGFWDKNICDGNLYTGTFKDPQKIVPPPQTPTTSLPITEEPQVGKQISGYSCNCSKACGSMASCDEAYYQLNTCGCSARDGDDDGIPCESLCR